MTQPDLFSTLPKARATDPTSSHLAAKAFTPQRVSQRDRVHRALADRALTACELEAVLDIPRHIAARRVTDLVQEGRARDSGVRRLTDRGCESIVWEAL